MEWFQSILTGENGSAFQLVMITLALVVTLVLLVWLFRHILSAPTRRAARNRVPRLSITDVTAVDQKRFLILARRDDVEHLILIGGASDLVVETNIIRTQAVKQRAPDQATIPPVPEPVAEPVSAPVAATSVPIAAAAALTATASPEPEPDETLANESAPVTVADEPKPVVEMSVRAEEPAPVQALPAKEKSDEVTLPVIEDLEVEEPETELEPNIETPIIASSDQDSPIGIDNLEIIEPDEPDAPDAPDATVSVDIETVIDAADETQEISPPGENKPGAGDTASLASDIDARISQQLDEALTNGALDIEAMATARPGGEQSSEDDMEKLLQELAAETR